MPTVQLLARHHQQAKVTGPTRQAGTGHFVRGLQQAIFEQQWPFLSFEPGWCRHAEMAAGLGRQNQCDTRLQVQRRLALPLALHTAASDQRPVPGCTRSQQQPGPGRCTPPPFNFHERPHGSAKVQT